MDGTATELEPFGLAPMDYKYTSIDDTSETRRAHWWHLSRREIVSAILIAILSSAATIGITSLLSTRGGAQSQSHQQPLSCGKTFESASQYGCTFDALTLTWLRPECSQFGNDEYSNAGDGNETWRYFKENQEEATDSLLDLGHYDSLAYLPPGTLYLATYEQFLTHCVWILLRVHNALEYGKRLDYVSISYAHSKDCLNLLLTEAKRGVGEEKLRQLSTHAVANEIDYGVC